MKAISRAMIVLGLLLGCTASAMADITWTLSGLTFSNGNGVTGYFVTNDAVNAIDSFDIEITGPTEFTVASVNAAYLPGEIGIAGVGRRCTDADEEEPRAGGRVLQPRRKVQPLTVARNQRVEPRLVYRHLASLQALDLGFVDVHAVDIAAEVSEAGGRHQTDIPSADYPDRLSACTHEGPKAIEALGSARRNRAGRAARAGGSARAARARASSRAAGWADLGARPRVRDVEGVTCCRQGADGGGRAQRVAQAESAAGARLEVDRPIGPGRIIDRALVAAIAADGGGACIRERDTPEIGQGKRRAVAAIAVGRRLGDPLGRADIRMR